MSLRTMMTFLCWLLAACAAFVADGASSSSSSSGDSHGGRGRGGGHPEPSKCVSGFCLPVGYNKLEAPEGRSDVGLSLFVTDVLSVDDTNFSLTLYAYLGIGWHEPRMFWEEGGEAGSDHHHKDFHNVLLGVDIDPQFAESLWLPHIMIGRMKSFEEISATRPQTMLNVRFPRNITRGGFELYYLQGVVITFLCPMRFNWYPLDAHVCHLYFGSSVDDTRMVLSTTELRYDPKSTNVVLEYSVSMRQLNSTETPSIPLTRRGNYTTSGIKITLSRNKLKYLSHYYLPSGVFVIVSWASFLIPPEIVAGRMAMLITLFLCLINIFLGTTRSSPNSDFIDALTVWMVFCIQFVYGALIAYSYLLYLQKPRVLFQGRGNINKQASKINNHHGRQPVQDAESEPESDGAEDLRLRKREIASSAKNHNRSPPLEPSAGEEVIHSPPPSPATARFRAATRREVKRKMSMVDDVCLVVFPACFAVFNALYWGTTLTRDPEAAAHTDSTEELMGYFDLFKGTTFHS